MRSFRVENGDLALSPGRIVDFVQGQNKLVQDLTLWLLEPYGIGYTTPAFGSLLLSMIGTAFGEGQLADVESEVNRILELYQANQFQRIKAARDNGKLYLYTKREILNQIGQITSTQLLDHAQIQVGIKTASGQDTQIAAILDDNGAFVVAQGT